MNNKYLNDDYDSGPTLDEKAQAHGYADYQDYCDEYWQGHGDELGEPGCPEDDFGLDDAAKTQFWDQNIRSSWDQWGESGGL